MGNARWVEGQEEGSATVGKCKYSGEVNACMSTERSPEMLPVLAAQCRAPSRGIGKRSHATSECSDSVVRSQRHFSSTSQSYR